MGNPFEKVEVPKEVRVGQGEWSSGSDMTQAFMEFIKTSGQRAVTELEQRGWNEIAAQDNMEGRSQQGAWHQTWENGAAYFLQLTGEELPEDPVELYHRIDKITGPPHRMGPDPDTGPAIVRGVRLESLVKRGQMPDSEYIQLETPQGIRTLHIGKVTSPEKYLYLLKQGLSEAGESIYEDLKKERIDEEQGKMFHYISTNAARSHARGFGLAALEQGKVVMALENLSFAQALGLSSDGYDIAGRLSTKIGELESSESPEDRAEFEKVKKYLVEQTAADDRPKEE